MIMDNMIILSAFAVHWVLIVILIYVIWQLKSQIILLESKIYGQQLSLTKLQGNVEEINKLLNINFTAKWSKKSRI